MQILYEKGYAIDKDVELVVNSANGVLLYGKDGVEKIMEKSKELGFQEKVIYFMALEQLPKEVNKFYADTYKKYKWLVTQAQASAMSLVLKNGNNEFEPGEAVLDDLVVDGKRIVHAVAMTYKLTEDSHERVPATQETIRQAVDKAFKIAGELNVESVALPVIGCRGSYGVEPKESYEAIMSIIDDLGDSGIEKVVMCFEHKESMDLLSTIKTQNY